MARRTRLSRSPQPLPPPLPPERRTIGQLVAETIRFYQQRFFLVLPLGIPVAALVQLTTAFGRRHDEPRGYPPPRDFREPHALLGGFETTLIISSLLFTASYLVAIVLVTGTRPDRRRLATAYGVGVVVWIPVPLLVALLGFLALPAVLYLGFMGWAVPAALVEGTGFREAFGRALRLGRVDYGHAAGGLATLVVLYGLVRLMLVLLIRTGGELGERSTTVLADLVLSPILFVGAAILYLDQAARVAARK